MAAGAVGRFRARRRRTGRAGQSLATEPALGQPLAVVVARRPSPSRSTIRRHDHAPDPDRLQSFASMFPVLDYAILPPRWRDGSDEVGRFLWPSTTISAERAWTPSACARRAATPSPLTASWRRRPTRSSARVAPRAARATPGSRSASAPSSGRGRRRHRRCGPNTRALRCRPRWANHRRAGERAAPFSQATLLLHTAPATLPDRRAVDAPSECRAELTPWLSAAKVTVTNHAVTAVTTTACVLQAAPG